jgi:hypothetical protein
LRDPQALQSIPGVGPSIVDDLHSLNINTVRDLKGKDPEHLFEELCRRSGTAIDRCVLYVFRAAVYYATHQEHDPKLLKWWNWRDSDRGGTWQPSLRHVQGAH